jgi:uncharacterized membrane protein YedE/YeeE
VVDRAEKRNELWAYGITGVFILISLMYYSVNTYYIYLVAYIWFGFAYGMMLQYGRFCFASAFRDLFAVGVPRMFVGIMIAMSAFGLVSVFLAATKMETFHAGPIGIHETIGGLVFGIGMVLAGGCASGTLYKCGEGNGTSMLAAIAISFSQAIFVNIGGWFDKFLTGFVWKQPKVTVANTALIADHFSGASRYFVGNALINTIVPSLLLFVAVYLIWPRKGFLKKRMKERGGKKGLKDELAGIWAMITQSKRTSLAGILIGITAGVHIFVIKGMQIKFGVNNFGQLLTLMGFTGDVSTKGTIFDPGYWYITTQEAQLGAWVLEKVGMNMHKNIFFGVNNGLPEPLRNPALWMSVGIIFGAMVMALLNKEFKLKIPKGELIVWGLLGGTLMGLGARLALGCNIGAFFIRIAGGDPGGWVFGAGMILGAFIGVKFFNWWTERKMAEAANL